MQHTADIFNSVIDEHKGIIYKIANSYCRYEEDRKDLIQEMLMQIWRAFPNYDKQYKYSTWIYRIALNVAISFYRRESRRKVIANPLPDEIIYLTHEHGDGDSTANIRLLQQFISGLKALDRALILLYLEEKSHKEMAEILGLSETNIATKISRIKQKLRKNFSTVKDN